MANMGYDSSKLSKTKSGSGDYIWHYDITEGMKELLGDIIEKAEFQETDTNLENRSEAVEWAKSIEEDVNKAVSGLQNYINVDYSYLYITFNNHKTVCFNTSEWGDLTFL